MFVYRTALRLTAIVFAVWTNIWICFILLNFFIAFQSAKKAANLRAKFEKWEAEENRQNQENKVGYSDEKIKLAELDHKQS